MLLYSELVLELQDTILSRRKLHPEGLRGRRHRSVEGLRRVLALQALRPRGKLRDVPVAEWQADEDLAIHVFAKPMVGWLL